MDCRGTSSQAAAPRSSFFQRTLRSAFPGIARQAPVRCDEGLIDGGLIDGGLADEPPAPKAQENTPVQFEQFPREWQQMSQQDNFDGFRIEAANQVTKFMQAAHTLFLGTQLRPEQYIYQFGPAFQSEDQRTMLVARCGLDGGVNGRAVQKIGSGLQVTASSNSHLTEPQRNMHEFSAEYTGGRFAAGAKLMNQGAWLLGTSITAKLTQRLQLGGDLTGVYIGQRPDFAFPQRPDMLISQVGARYTDKSNIFGATLARTPDPKLGPGQFSNECRLNFVRKVTDRLSLGTEYKVTLPDMESGLQLGYEYSFRQARVQGLIDTDGKVSCCVSDFVGFGFSGMIDYMKGDYKFGVVMHVLPQPDQPPQ